MKSRTPAFIVCSLSGRVGKTMTARLLADYFLLSGRSFAGFDTDAFEPAFATWFPQQVVVADLNTVQGRMALLDPLLVNDDVPKVIDLWHRSMEGFFALLEDTQFVAEARRVSVEPVLLFMADGSLHSADVADRLMARYPDVTMVTVVNEGAAPFGEVGLDQLARYPASRTFRIAALDPILQRTIEVSGFSLSRFVLAPPSGMSIVVRSGLKAWLGRVLAQFQSFELSMTLEQTEHFG
jgi:hypothetical protein